MFLWEENEKIEIQENTVMIKNALNKNNLTPVLQIPNSVSHKR